jgi:NTP pyrophosphatase (non-canonical NTP hydrolase)
VKPNKYQKLALKTGDNVKLNEYQAGAKSTAIYPGKLAYPTLGMCGEIGELIDACRFGRDEDTPKEAGDVLWYVANVAADAGLELEEVCKQKTFKLKRFSSWDWTEACEEMSVAAGVVAENVKKTIRDNDGVLTDARRDNIRKALKKVVLALAAVVYYFDCTLEECAKMNLEKLLSRQERGKLGGDGDNR